MAFSRSAMASRCFGKSDILRSTHEHLVRIFSSPGTTKNSQISRGAAALLDADAYLATPLDPDAGRHFAD